ncbi:MAG: hypothetical protein E7269_00250 [Lachnospiraceae bacterium]|nr:hypothetical protein [Lachnospiraceae bacterium]
MKKVMKRALALVAVFVMFCCMSATAMAASTTVTLETDEAISLVLSSDKDSYKGDEVMELSLTVTNNSNAYIIRDIDIREILPDGMTEAEPGSGFSGVPQVPRGGSKLVTGTYVGSSEVFGKGGPGVGLYIGIAVIAVVVIAVVAAVVVLMKKKKAKVPVAMLLIAVMLAMTFATIPVSAADSVEQAAIVLTVPYGDAEIELRFVASITLADAPMSISFEDKVSTTTASVHDPSIVVDTDADGKTTYYVFGSHRAIAKSTDLMNWSNTAEGVFGKIDETGATVSAGYGETFDKNFYTGKVEALDANGNVVEKDFASTATTIIGTDGTEMTIDLGNFDGEAWASAWGTYDAAGNWISPGYSLDGNMWAPDVIYNETTGKWMMYYSLNGPKWNSCIVLLTADEVTGPYVYQGPVIYSGFSKDETSPVSYKLTDIELALGELTELPTKYSGFITTATKTYGGKTYKVCSGGSWGDNWPHAIDPCVEYDENGDLWMSYGSWSGGIYMIKLDNETGLRDYTYTYESNELFAERTTDNYFGVKLAGGSYITGEASYIEKVGDYYYLWISYGGLETASGYNMRVYRSENIYGPYKDYKDKSGEATSWADWYNRSNGVRLFGAYKWAMMSSAEVAQGHNSAFVDADGKAYVVYHTRFVNPSATTQGEGHQVRVHQLLTTKGGWIVAAPFKYSGETVDYDNPAVSKEELIGNFQIMIHELGVDYKNYDYVEAVACKLNEDGTISGALTGTWELDADGKAYMTIEVDDDTYDCVYFKQCLEGTSIEVPVFTGLGDNQLTIWGFQMPENY